MQVTGIRGRSTVVAAMVLALGAAGCSGGSDGGGGDEGRERAAWQMRTDPVHAEAPIWSEGSVVHLADGTDVDLGEVPVSYAVAGDGVFFVPAADEEEARSGSLGVGQIRFVAPDGDPVDTGLTWQARSLRASPDGRYLAGIDEASGPEDEYGTPAWEVVVLDLGTGEEIIRTSEPMGDPEEDDFTDLYSETDPALGYLTDQTLLVDGPSRSQVLDLSTGKLSEPDPVFDDGDPLLTNSDASWRIEQRRGLRDRVVHRDGDVSDIKVPTKLRALKWWASDLVVAGATVRGKGRVRLLTCNLFNATCQEHGRLTEETVVRLPSAPGTAQSVNVVVDDRLQAEADVPGA